MEKELKNKITGLKKQKGAVSKEAKKELEKQIEQLEKELKLLKNKQQNDQNQESNNDQETHQETHQEISALEMEASTAVKQSKGKKRKNKKMQELEAMRKEAEEEAKSMPNYKEQEDIALDTLANDMSRKIVPVPADGNCLYYAISRQLQLVGAETAYTFKQLRGLAASWMKDHPDDFLPFLLNKQGDMLSQEEFGKYLQDCEFGSMWAGQFEIQALAQSLQRPIHIIQVGSPVLILGEEFDQPPLLISYHKHAYALGEHYNSLE